MKRKISVRTQLLLGFFISVFCAHLPVVYTVFFHSITSAPTAIDGELKLPSDYRGERIILDGSWDFYWNRFNVTDDTVAAGHRTDKYRFPDTGPNKNSMDVFSLPMDMPAIPFNYIPPQLQNL